MLKMAPQDIIIYISLLVSIAVLFFIIWDHIKDDKILAMEVQEFYEDIEWLIFTNIQVKYYEALQETEETVKDEELSSLIKYKNRDNNQKNYRSTKINQHFKIYSKYLGLTWNKETHNYLNGTVFILKEDGALLKRNNETNKEENIIQSFTEIKREQISEILNYLNTLKFYWRKNYMKPIFRPALKNIVDFNNLLGYIKPLEQPKPKRRRIVKRKG